MGKSSERSILILRSAFIFTRNKLQNFLHSNTKSILLSGWRTHNLYIASVIFTLKKDSHMNKISSKHSLTNVKTLNPKGIPNPIQLTDSLRSGEAIFRYLNLSLFILKNRLHLESTILKTSHFLFQKIAFFRKLLSFKIHFLPIRLLYTAFVKWHRLTTEVYEMVTGKDQLRCECLEMKGHFMKVFSTLKTGLTNPDCQQITLRVPICRINNHPWMLLEGKEKNWWLPESGQEILKLWYNLADKDCKSLSFATRCTDFSISSWQKG